MTNGVLQGIDQMKLPVIHAAISLAIHVPLLYVLLKVFRLGAYGLVFGNMTFAIVICILNWRAVGKLIGYRQEIFKTFCLPLIASLIMGAVTYVTFKFVHPFLKSTTLSLILCMVVAFVIYGVSVILFRTVSEEELLEMPKGGLILRICKKLHMM